MHADRDDLHRLVEELPEDEVRAALQDVRRRRDEVRRTRKWPPTWFGAAGGRRTDTAAGSEELLADGFGRQT